METNDLLYDIEEPPLKVLWSLGYRYTDTESAEDSLDHNESCHADTIVETDVTEEYRRKNTVNRICFQIICRCQDDLRIGRKDTRQKISMEKAG